MSIKVSEDSDFSLVSKKTSANPTI